MNHFIESVTRDADDDIMLKFTITNLVQIILLRIGYSTIFKDSVSMHYKRYYTTMINKYIWV